MVKFAYTALDAKGKESKGTIEADSQNAALAKLREQGLFPTQISDTSAAASGGRKGGLPVPGTAGRAARAKSRGKPLKLPFGGGVKTKQLMIVTRQLATLIDAGLPLLRSLQVIARQERNSTLKRTLNDLAESIQSGSTLAEAMAQHGKVFDRLYVNMVKAGEVGGVLDVVLLRLAEFMEKMQKIRNKVRSAMTYPVVVLCVAGGIMYFLMTKIVPKFADIFNDVLEGSKMPALTVFIMNASHTLANRAPVFIGAIVALVLLINAVGRTRTGRLALDKIKLRMPVFGALVHKTAIARFTRTLGTLLSSGVPILQALNIVRDTAGNEVIARGVVLVHDSVKEGENIAPPIEASGIFPPMVVSMVEVGEETGKLPEMLMRIADTYDDEVDNTVAALSSIIEPILIVGLAVIVGTIVVALFLPMVAIMGNIAK